MSQYVLCIDNGSTIIKAVLFTFDGHEMGKSQVKSPAVSHGVFVEVDMDALWECTIEIIRDLLSKTCIKSSEIAVIGVSGYGNGLFAIDMEGKPVRQAITSADTRAQALVDHWELEGLHAADLTCQQMGAFQTIPILRWLKEKEPQFYENIDRILYSKDWINYKLTGLTGTDYTDASIGGLLNLYTKTYDKEIFRRYGVEEVFNKLPLLSKSTRIMGEVTKSASAQTGLNEGTPVISGMMDAAANMIGSGICSSDKYCIIGGTWGNNMCIDEALLYHKDIQLTFLFADAEKYVLFEGSPTSAVNLEWFITNILKPVLPGMSVSDFYQQMEIELVKIKAEELDLYYIPFIYKSKLSNANGGSFIHFDASNNIYHLLKALLEGVVFAHRMHLENLCKAGIPKKTAVLSGGAANSGVWCQLYADILGMEIQTTKSKDVGAMGVMIAASNAIGRYQSLEEASSRMVGMYQSYLPNRLNQRIYDEKYKKFIQLVQNG
jgi:L-xylulokinase